jgi:hypothetical protein
MLDFFYASSATPSLRRFPLPMHLATPTWLSPTEIECSWQGDFIGPAVRDPSYVIDPGNYGIGFKQTGGSAVTISSISDTYNGNKFKITLSGPATGSAKTVTVARQAISQVGPNGPRCNFRGSNADGLTISGNFYPAWDLPVPQEILTA